MIKKQKELNFIIAASYLISLIAIRLSVFLAGAANTEFAKATEIGALPEVKFHIGRNLILFGYHIHHFYIGILFIIIAGWIGITGSKHLERKHLAAIYGVGLGLFMDEIGLLLTWGDYYSELTYLVSLFLLGIFLNILFFESFWKRVKINLETGEKASILRNKRAIQIIDWFSSKISKTKRISHLFSSIIFLSIAVLIIILPNFFIYWIAGGFFLQGANYVIKGITEE